MAIKAALKDQERGRHRHRLRRRAAPRQRHRLLPGAHARRRDPASRPRRSTATTTTPTCSTASRHDEARRRSGCRRPTASRASYTDRPVKFSLTGPFSLSRRRAQTSALRRRGRPGHGLRAACSTARRARWPRPGADVLQVDEPFLAGYPEHVELAVEALNAVFDGRRTARRARCTSATATATPARCGRGTTTSSSRPSSTPTSTSSCWSSRARATTTSR